MVDEAHGNELGQIIDRTIGYDGEAFNVFLS